MLGHAASNASEKSHRRLPHQLLTSVNKAMLALYRATVPSTQLCADVIHVARAGIIAHRYAAAWLAGRDTYFGVCLMWLFDGREEPAHIVCVAKSGDIVLRNVNLERSRNANS